MALAEKGAVVFGDLISRADFVELVRKYDQLMDEHGSVSPLHSYLDLRNYPEFLTDTSYSDAFLHPLIVALIAHEMGGPVRVIDTRCKDAQPLTARAQDNMLHIDNTPFNDEVKVILTWEKGTTSGPKGQNLVFLPGTHKGVRNCFWSPENGAWSTENSSVFASVESIQRALEFQKHVTGASAPIVIEVQNSERPLTTVFAAGSLVHHRYRTTEGSARSAVSVAFHLSSDNPGQYLVSGGVSTHNEMGQYLFGCQKGITRTFLDTVFQHATIIGAKIAEIMSVGGGTIVVDQELMKLSPAQMQKWFATVADAPEIEEIKSKYQKSPIGQKVTRKELLATLGRDMMLYDKHGPLDLILYADNHEESRKWARKRFREMKLDRMEDRLLKWTADLRQPRLEDLLFPEQLAEIAGELIECVKQSTDAQRDLALVDDGTPTEIAFGSVQQLLSDLAESVRRCHSLQSFLSTSLFVFWSSDELCQLQGQTVDDRLMAFGGRLLRHYLATAILAHDLKSGADTGCC